MYRAGQFFKFFNARRIEFADRKRETKKKKKNTSNSSYFKWIYAIE